MSLSAANEGKMVTCWVVGPVTAGLTIMARLQQLQPRQQPQSNTTTHTRHSLGVANNMCMRCLVHSLTKCSQWQRQQQWVMKVRHLDHLHCGRTGWEKVKLEIYILYEFILCLRYFSYFPVKTSLTELLSSLTALTLTFLQFIAFTLAPLVTQSGSYRWWWLHCAGAW